MRSSADTEVEELAPTYLRIQIQPNEGMWFDLLAKRPGQALEDGKHRPGLRLQGFL